MDSNQPQPASYDEFDAAIEAALDWGRCDPVPDEPITYDSATEEAAPDESDLYNSATQDTEMVDAVRNDDFYFGTDFGPEASAETTAALLGEANNGTGQAVDSVHPSDGEDASVSRRDSTGGTSTASSNGKDRPDPALHNEHQADNTGNFLQQIMQRTESEATVSQDIDLEPATDHQSNFTAEALDQDESDENAQLSSRLNRLQIKIVALPKSLCDEYSAVVSDTVDCIHHADQESESYQVEFTDGRIENVPFDDIFSFENSQVALDEFLNDTSKMNPPNKSTIDDDYGSASESDGNDVASDAMDLDSDGSEVTTRMPTRRTLRTASRRPRILLKRSQSSANSDQNEPQVTRSLRPRSSKIPNYFSAENDQEPSKRRSNGVSDYGDGDNDFLPVVSDIVTLSKGRSKGRPRLMRSTYSQHNKLSERDSDIKFEPLRRSSRATKNTTIMDDDIDFDDDDLDVPIIKERGAPKVISVKEVFQVISPESSFGAVHMQRCLVCHGSKQRGQLIYCQGCCVTYHKGCIGYRGGREHMVTKVGQDSFVLQCRFCIGVYTQRDEYAPRYDMCQHCKQPGSACAAFSKKLTGRQEEKLREENNGVDPVTVVAPNLVNNSQVVLFRCKDCHRAWHLHHLPGKVNIESDLSSSPSKKWSCSECQTVTEKIHRLVAWRPTRAELQIQGKQAPLYHHVPEDDKEYLVKWESKSYAHCTWLPGAWVFGLTAGVMRKAFGKRDMELGLLKLHQRDAVPDEFLAPDIILIAKMAADAPVAHSKADMLKNIRHVSRILVKFQGLGYDDVVWDLPPTPDKDALYSAFVSAYAEYVNGKYFHNEPQASIRGRVEKFKNEEFEELTAQPQGIKRGKLMGYQLEGLNWLLGNYHHGRSVVLADEMGLGKTVQVVSLVTSLVQDKPKCWPFLIVVPNATCPNWRREFRQWAPDIRVVAYHGGREAQELVYQYELFPEKTAGMRAHVVIMSYDSAQDPRTATLFKSVKWAGLVVDEGQRLKNDQNILYQALRGMKIPFRLLLTGTPLQNNKRELFNLLQFIDTSQNAAALDEEYQVLDKETLPKLHEQIRPYFLRRTKAGVLKFLPPMAQIIVPVTMTVVQEKLSKSIMSKRPELIKAIFADSKLKVSERGSLNNIMMQLRKCLCHPFMYSENIEEKHDDASVMHRNLVEASAKLLLLNIMLPKLKERGHRVLIFSQFLQQLDIIEDFLNGIGFGYKRLDGSMSSLEKQRRIDAFNAPDSGLFAFLLSTRAGGVGINLATADTVIILDPDFNPHQDLQALSRAHRIGQKNKVLCLQLMTKDSVEERIMQIGRSKMALDHALIESMDDDELEGADLESILKHGASALFNEDYQKTKIEYTAAMVDSLLDRSQIEQAKVEEKADKETPFAYARVWDSEKTGFEDMPTAEAEAPVPIGSGFWDKIIAEREEEARRKAESNREVLGRGGRRRRNVNYNSHGDVQMENTEEAMASNESDEFSTQESSSESDDDVGNKDAKDADVGELTKETKTTQGSRQEKGGPAQGKEGTAAKQVGVSSREKAAGSAQGANIRFKAQTGPSGMKNGGARHPLGTMQRAPVAAVPSQVVPSQAVSSQAVPSQAVLTSQVVAEIWQCISGLHTEAHIRIAIDDITQKPDKSEHPTVRQMRLYALHERLRQLPPRSLIRR